MTSSGSIDWEIADLDETSSIASTGWRRPRTVTLDGDELVFEWPHDLVLHASSARRLGPLSADQWRDRRRFLMAFGADVSPSRALLFDFAQLDGAPPERIRRFAARYGALQEQVPRRAAWPVPPLLPDRQPISYWRLISGSFREALDLAAVQDRTQAQDDQLAWLVNGHLFQADVVDYLVLGHGAPRILHGSGGLYGGLAVELLAAVARVGVRLCTGCGRELEKGGRRYCRTCRDDHVPARIRSQRRRAKHARLVRG